MPCEAGGKQQRRLTRWLPERRLYIRSETGTRHVRLSPLAQAGAAVAIAAVLSWTAFATVAYVRGGLERSELEERLAARSAGLELRMREMAGRQAALEAALAELRREKASLAAALERKQERLAEAELRLAETEEGAALLRERLAALTAARSLAEERNAALEGRAAALERALAAAQAEGAELAGALDALTAEMERVLAERDEARRRVAELSAETERLDRELAELGERHERLLSTIETATRESIADLTRAFAGTDVDLERILGDLREGFDGRGGPFVPVEDGPPPDIAPEIDLTAFEFEELAPAGESPPDPDLRLASLVEDLGTLDMLRYAAERMPFGAPVEIGRLTSAFGPRRDPRSGRRAFHEGMDIAGPRGTPIYATGDGVVTFAGRQRGYGIVVKIRHAFGFETVYAHMSRARVKKGQRVERGDRIGDMGSTGRSTGSHVHYEVRINAKPVNPMKFIEAARDVL